MVEKFLLDIGMRCGTVKNFNTAILEDVRKDDSQHWYFLTPLKISEKENGLKECSLNLAFPFLANKDEMKESEVIKRLMPLLPEFESELLKHLREMLIIPSYSFSLIPFWANEKSEKVERKDFAQVRVHILNAVLTVNFRDRWFNCNCN